MRQDRFRVSQIQSRINPSQGVANNGRTSESVMCTSSSSQKNTKERRESLRSLEEKMGRTLSLLGLARAHSLLGSRKQATFFYQYLRSQLQQADEGNLAVREAENWASSSKSKIAAEKLRDGWFWPELLARSLSNEILLETHHGLYFNQYN